MEKVAAWFRRHKTKFFDISIVVGLALIVWAFFNAPVNINRMQPGDWNDTHISKIGAVTVQKLQANAPYADMRDIKHIAGIGPVKQAQIQRYFTTWDTAKADSWFPLDIAALIIFFGFLYLRIMTGIKKERKAKWLDEKLFGDKNVKR